MIKSRKIIWAGHVARMGECKGVYSVLVGNMRERDHFGDPGVDGMDLQEVGCGDVDWMELASWEAMHRWQRLVHPSKQFWNWFCGMAFRAAVVLLLMSSMSSKCLPFNISFIFGNRKKSLGARSGE